MLAEDGKKSIIILTVLTPTTTTFLVLRLILRKRRNVLGLMTAYSPLLCSCSISNMSALYQVCHRNSTPHLSGAPNPLFSVAIKGGEGKSMESLTPDELTWLLKESP